MVSLSGNSRQGGQGGMTFFSDSLSSYHDDDPLLDAGMPVLPQNQAVGRWMTQEIKKYRTIRTVKVILLSMFLYMCLVISAFLLPLYCGPGRGWCGGEEGTSLLLYVHGGLWFLLVWVHLYLAGEQRTSLLHGYFAFHQDTRTLKRLPLLINSAGNAACVVVSQVFTGVCGTGDRCGPLPKAAYLQMLVSLEGAVALVALIVYLVKTVRFNRAKDVPDFLRVSKSEDVPRVQQQIGFRGGQSTYQGQKTLAMTRMWHEVLYWKHRRAALCVDILELQDRLEEVGQQQAPQAPQAPV